MHGTTGFTVELHPKKLIDALRANRARHEAEYKEAVEAFGKAYDQKIHEMFEALDESDFDATEADMHVGLRIPENHLDDYDRVTGMLSMAPSDALIEMTEEQYRMYVEDKWSWSSDFATTNQFYVN